jgi:hypothetical protein
MHQSHFFQPPRQTAFGPIQNQPNLHMSSRQELIYPNTGPPPFSFPPHHPPGEGCYVERFGASADTYSSVKRETRDPVHYVPGSNFLPTYLGTPKRHVQMGFYDGPNTYYQDQYASNSTSTAQGKMKHDIPFKMNIDKYLNLSCK